MKTGIFLLVLSFILVAHDVYGAQTTLTWAEGSGGNPEEGFTIERDDNGAGFKSIAAVKANVTTYIDNTLVTPSPANPPGKNTYCFRVTAFNHGNPVPPATQGPLQVSGYSNTSCVDVLGVALIGPPAAPSNLTTTQATGLSARVKPAARKK